MMATSLLSKMAKHPYSQNIPMDIKALLNPGKDELLELRGVITSL